MRLTGLPRGTAWLGAGTFLVRESAQLIVR